MSPVHPSLWKKHWISIAAIFTAIILLFVQHRIDDNRKALPSVQKAAVVCREVNERVFDDQHPFAPSDLAERRRFIVKEIIGDPVWTIEQFDQELKVALKDAKRLNLEPSELADIAHAAGDLPLAEKAAREALGGANQNQPMHHVILGDILYASKKYPEAEAEYRKAVELTVHDRKFRSFNPIQRLARLYADEQTATPTLDASGNEIPRQTLIIGRKQFSLGYWQDVVTTHENSLNAQQSERTGARIPLANACIHFAHALRDCGRFKEARAEYIRAYKGFRKIFGGDDEITKKVMQYVEALPAEGGKDSKQ